MKNKNIAFVMMVMAIIMTITFFGGVTVKAEPNVGSSWPCTHYSEEGAIIFKANSDGTFSTVPPAKEYQCSSGIVTSLPSPYLPTSDLFYSPIIVGQWYHTDSSRNHLTLCGCCYDDLPASVAPCTHGGTKLVYVIAVSGDNVVVEKYDPLDWTNTYDATYLSLSSDFSGTPVVGKVYHKLTSGKYALCQNDTPDPTPDPTPAPDSTNESHRHTKENKTEAIDRDTYKSEVPFGTVIVTDAPGVESFFDMKVHSVDNRTIANQKLLVRTLIGSDAGILVTENVHPRRDLSTTENGSIKTLIHKNLPKNQAGVAYAVVYNEKDGAYVINGTLDANGTATFKGFKLRSASTITICK